MEPPLTSCTDLAFSHFTYVETGGKLMVLDLQGCQPLGESFYILTDPGVQFADPKYSLSTINLGEDHRLFCSSGSEWGYTGQEGMDAFFKTHQCNSVCAAMKLDTSKSAGVNDKLKSVSNKSK